MPSAPMVQVGPQRQYPPIRVAHSPGYASSTSSTLAESQPPSPVYHPHLHGDEDPESSVYRSKYGSLRKKSKPEKQPWTSKPVVIKLLTSITVGVIVCLIVAAVVGKIRASNASNSMGMNPTVNGTAASTPTAAVITLVDDSTTSPTSTVASDSPSATSSSSPSSTSITLPVGHNVANFDCPYVKEPRRRSSLEQARAPSMRLCRLLSTEKTAQDKLPETSGVTVAKVDGCTIARGSYPGPSGEETQYHCTVSCVDEVKSGTLMEGVFSCE